MCNFTVTQFGDMYIYVYFMLNCGVRTIVRM